MRIVRIERRQRAAFLRRELPLEDRAALRVKFACRLRPVDGLDAHGGIGCEYGAEDIPCG
jgi:hypothetical protein